MSYTLYVVTKVFCKRAWLVALFAVCLLVLGPLSLIELIRFVEGSIGDDPVMPFSFHFAFLGVSWILFIAVCLHALQGSQKIIFGLPVSSASIASALMFVTVGIVVLLNLVTNGLYRIAFFDKNWLSDYWPLLGPTLFLVTLVMVGHCIFWNLHAIGFGRLLFWVGFVIAMFCWFILRYHPHGIEKQAVPWNHVSFSELVTMQVVWIGAWFWGTRSFSSVRRGTAVPSLQWTRMEAWLNQLTTGSLIEGKSVSISKSSALARLHWRDSCYVALILAVCLGVAGLIANLFFFSHLATFEFKNQNVNENVIAVPVMFTILAATIVLLAMGQGLNSKNMTEMKRYLAVAPLSDRAFSSVLMRNLIKCISLALLLVVLISFLLSNFIAALYYGFDNIRNTWLWFENQDAKRILATGFLILMAYWVVIANCVSVLWTGRKMFCATIAVLFSGAIISSIVVLSLIPRSLVPVVDHGIALFLACFILIATITAFYMARKGSLIPSSTVWIALLFSIIVSLMFWDFWKTDQFIDRFILSSALLLAVTPFATIPLAVSWNRHR
ncbi:MAG: hypothetical protein P1V19_17965 [Gimesia sp.]|nr:hypothetical protein [Gimesia sp.]